MAHASTPVSLPTEHYPADASWIQEQLQKLPAAMRQRAIMSYSTVYQETFDAEPVSFRQVNRARHEANTRLRLFVRKYYMAAMGLTEKPALASTHAPAGAVAEIQNDQTAEVWW